MAKKFTYEYVKNFIEVESNSGCKLISKEYANAYDELEVQCKCGNIFITSLLMFKYHSKHQCNNCGRRKAGDDKRLTLAYVKNFIEIESNSGCKLLSTEYINNSDPLEIQCSCGNKFYTNFSRFKDKKKKQRQCDICSGKIKWTYDKVKTFIEQKGYYLISESYTDMFTKLIIKDNLGYFCLSTFSNIINSNPNFFHMNNPYTIQNIKLWCKLNNKPFELLNDTFEKSKINLKWKCLKEDCGEVFNMSWQNISKNQGCPYCAGVKVALSNCLATKRPDIASEWHPTLNGELTPYDVTCGSNKKVWWQCSKNATHIWFKGIAGRNSGDGCPFCSGRYASIENNLLVSNPLLSSEWNYERNDKKPENYTPNSSQKVWWKCKYGHEWPATISSRNHNKLGCPYCSHQLATPEYNLLVINPKLCEEWDYNKNEKRPEGYCPNSNNYAWWKCKECGHEWEAMINNRNKGRGCPQCNESKGEKRIKQIFNDKNVYFSSQYTFNNLLSNYGNLLRFDFAVFKDEEKNILQYLIEYDGEFHFEKYYEEQNFELQQYYDKLKNDYCNKNNIKLLRIPYWEFDNIEEILKKEFII